MSLIHPTVKLRKRTRRMLKRLPRKANVHRYPMLKHFGSWLLRFPALWSYKSPYTTRAIYIGSVVTFLPIMGGQILVGTLLAVLLRANLPITAGLQFVSNPLTGPVMYVLSYKTGKVLSMALGIHAAGWASAAATYLSVGGLALGLVLGLLIHVGVRLYHIHHQRRVAAFAQGSAA